MNYYAHTKTDDKTKQALPKEYWQRLSDHLTKVSELTSRRSSKFGAGKLGAVIGLLHDIGKYSEEFQQRLSGKKAKVDHSTAGAIELLKKYGNIIGKAIAYTVAGHHGGLPDGNKGSPSNLPERLKKTDIPYYLNYTKEIVVPQITQQDLLNMPKGMKGMESFSFCFAIRMLFSCLVDADFLDTENFMDSNKHQFRPEPISIEVLLQRFQRKIYELHARTNKNPTPINLARQKILKNCISAASQKSGIFTLTVPTGGGKTYSSLAFALNHAAKYHKERIIYVIPYTSIIEQNAEVFREALGEDNIILEHHSNFEYPEGDFNEWNNEEKTHRLASENWDMPLIVTTAVQFFESLYANKGSKCRKLHNIVNSVIILDEAQMMPIEFMKPCLWALSELVINYKATVVFCTATQPKIKELLPGGLKPTEIIENPLELQKAFKRVQVEYRGSLTDEELAGEMANEKQVLTIVNTRKHARTLFDNLAGRTQDGTYHLSARMCPAHRKDIFREIRNKLDSGDACRVVSTQLIEAGVDVDFPIVYRSAAGIDSIAQAAGRCNREGKKRSGKAYVFEPESYGMPQKGLFSATAAMTRSILRRIEQFDGDILSLEAIDEYFKQLLIHQKDSLDYFGILDSIQSGAYEMAFPFKKIADDFRLIDNPMYPIIIPWDDHANALMTEAMYSPYPASKARNLQPYTVQVYQHELIGLEKEGVLTLVGGMLRFLTDLSFYDKQFGLKDSKEVKAPTEVLLF